MIGRGTVEVYYLSTFLFFFSEGFREHYRIGTGTHGGLGWIGEGTGKGNNYDAFLRKTCVLTEAQTIVK
jgi:hypothetical protein